MSIEPRRPFCVETLNDELAGRSQPEIFNTDQSSKFAGCNFTCVLKGADVVFPWTAGARCMDNIFMASAAAAV